MKELIIVIPEGRVNLSSIIGSYKVFSGANRYYESRRGERVFNIRLAGLSDQLELYDGLFAVRPHVLLPAVERADLVIVPALMHDFERSLELNTPLSRWLADRYQEGSTLASLCTGVFLIAAAGLLEGKRCATHWLAEGAFRRMFPSANLLSGELITEEQGICTCGGAYSFLNLVLYLVEKYFDRETAIYCSKVFQVDVQRSSQSVFTMFSGMKDHDDALILQAQELIEASPDQNLSVAELSGRLAISRRNFDRRFVKATGNTPAEYSQRVKIEVAKKALESGDRAVGEVMGMVGYNDLRAFRMVFRKITGLSPIEYRNRYHHTRAKCLAL
jgi:transcriptional regulator GlxA family with amidase domain